METEGKPDDGKAHDAGVLRHAIREELERSTVKVDAAELRRAVTEEMGRCVPDMEALVKDEVERQREKGGGLGWALLKGAAWAAGALLVTHIIAALAGGEVRVDIIEKKRE